MKTLRKNNLRGSVLVIVCFVAAVLVSISGVILSYTLKRRESMSVGNTWDLSLNVAEAGITAAMGQLENSLDAYGSYPDFGRPVKVSTTNSKAVAPNTTSGTTAEWTGTGYSDHVINVPAMGYDSTGVQCKYRINFVPVALNGFVKPYYQIISIGTVKLPGGKEFGQIDSKDSVLRRVYTQTGGNLTYRSAVRKIEAWARPAYNNEGALTTDGLINLNNHNITVDAFDSSKPTVSPLPYPEYVARSSATGGIGTPGQYSATIGIVDGNVATNSAFAQAGNATIYGDMATNGGTVGNTDGIMGEIRDDAYTDLDPETVPTYMSSLKYATKADGVSPVKNPFSNKDVLVNSMTFMGGTKSNPKLLKMAGVTLSGSGDTVLFRPKQTSVTDSKTGVVTTTDYPDEGHFEVYIEGDFSTKGGGGTGDGAIQLFDKNTFVKFYIAGNVAIGGNGIVNLGAGAKAENLTMIGVSPAGATREWKFSGSSTFYGQVYAPLVDLVFAGGGADSVYVGSFVGKTASMNGNTTIMYDAALNKGGTLLRWYIGAWYEDMKFESASNYDDFNTTETTSGTGSYTTGKYNFGGSPVIKY